MKSNNILWILPLMFLLLISFTSAVGTAPNSADTVAYWALEDLTDETNTYSLTNDGATSGATGIIDYAYSFDGVNDYMYTSDLGFEGQGTDVAFSMCFWAKSVDTDGVSMVHGGSDESRSWRVGWRGNEKLTFELYNDVNNYIVIDSPAYIDTYDGLWTFYCVTYDGSETESGMNIYINANKETTTSGSNGVYTGLRSSTVTYISRLWDQSTYYEMDFDEVSIFDVALSSDEVSYLYNSGSPNSTQQYPFTAEILEKFTITTNLNNYSALIYGENINLDNITYTNYTVVPISPLQDYYYYEIGGDAKNVFSNFSGTTVNVNECYNGSVVSLIRSDATPTDRWLCNITIIQTTNIIPTLIKQKKYQTYSTTTGIIITELLQNDINLYNITLIPENTYYDNLTFNNYNISTNIDANFTLQQSLITVDVYDILGNLITDFNLTSGVETNSTGSVYVGHGENISINFSKSGWYNQTFYIGEVTGPRTVNLTGVYDQIINITAKAQISNTTLSNFSGYVLSGSYLINYNTTESYIEIQSLTNNNYTIFFEKDSYITNTSIITTNESIVYNYEISTYKLNSFYITFKDELTDSIITSTTTLDIISTSFSNNYSTNNGTLYLTLLDPLEYTFRYKSDGYNIRYKYITLFNDTFTELTLYLLNSTDVSNITIHIIDQNGFDVEEAIVKAQRYYLSDNVYREVESGLTNPEGETILSLQKNNEFHRFVIDYEGNTIKTTTPFIIESDTYNIQVIIGDVPGIQFDNYNSILYNLSFNTVTNNFNLEYNDLDGIGGEFCLKVYRIKYDGKELQSSVCDTSSSGVLLGSVTNLSGSIWLGEAYWDTNKFLEGKTIEFETENPSGNMGLFMHIFISITLLILGIMLSPGIGVAGLGISFIIGRMIGLNTFPWWVNGMIFTMSIIIAFIIENKSK